MKRSLVGMKFPNIGLRPLDIPIVALILALAIASGIAIYGGRNGTVHLEIESPEGQWVYDLDTDRTVSVPGPLGETMVEIREGTARIVESPCPNQTCVAAPAVSHKGEWNACLPNEVIIRVAGEDTADDGLDAIVY